MIAILDISFDKIVNWFEVNTENFTIIKITVFCTLSCSKNMLYEIFKKSICTCSDIRIIGKNGRGLWVNKIIFRQYLKRIVSNEESQLNRWKFLLVNGF